ncbi:MAG: 3-hydroxyacyl-ACP dehydratase FabZ [Candidatus Omnitrophica bacterium]|nr:3-hydroxyacyl-ACP dehydratase FabZ [Candidatus Omnitrophota bacterium]
MQITQEEIREILPHRYPFIFIDRILEFEPEKKIIALKNFTVNEYYTPGHFPDKPIMPGVLIVEAMAQASIIFFAKSYPERLQKNTIYYLGKVEARFLHPVIPGDQLRIEVIPLKLLKNMGIVSAQVFVKDNLVAQAQLGFSAK